MNRTWQNMVANIKREKLMSLSNVTIMTITFVILGLFVFVIAVSQTSLRYLESQVQVTIFFKDDYPEESILNLRTELEQDARISQVNYISKEDAYRLFTEFNKDEPILLESISVSILPASLEIKTVKLSDLSIISEEVSTIDGVEEVRFFSDVVEKFRFWSTMVYIVGFALASAFLVVSYSVIIGTLRATIHSKGIELEIQKLVGATDKYVKLPLIYQGVLFGLISSLISGIFMILLGLVLTQLGWFADGLAFGFIHSLRVSPLVFSLVLTVLLMLSGALLGFVGSHTAIKRYLRY